MELGINFSDLDLEPNVSKLAPRNQGVYSPKLESSGWFLSDASDPVTKDIMSRQAAYMYYKNKFEAAANCYEQLIRLHRGNPVVLREVFDSCIRCYLRMKCWKRACELLVDYREALVNRQHMFCWFSLVVELYLVSDGSEIVRNVFMFQLELTPLFVCQWLVQMDNQCPLLWFKLYEVYGHILREFAVERKPDDDTFQSSVCVGIPSDEEMSNTTPLTSGKFVEKALHWKSITTYLATETVDDVVEFLKARQRLCLLYCSVCWQVVLHGCGALFSKQAQSKWDEVECRLRDLGGVPDLWRDISRRFITAPQLLNNEEFVDLGSSKFQSENDGKMWNESLCGDEFDRKWFGAFTKHS